MIVGLTGGIASGKSTMSRELERLGAYIIDADKISREVSSSSKIVEEIGRKLGEKVIVNNKVDRKKLKEIIFNNKEKRELLNVIMHPAIVKKMEEEIKKNSNRNIIILDIPLLYEAKLEYLCDKTLLVWTKEEIQVKRMIKRDNISIELAKSIIDSQMSLEIKKEKSDYLVENNSGIKELKRKIEIIYDIIQDVLKVVY